MRRMCGARSLIQASNESAKLGMLDFDDQLYLPLLWKLRLFQNDFVFIDEAQDTNPVRRALAKLALRPGGRLIAVGDPRQAIYGFTGASHEYRIDRPTGNAVFYVDGTQVATSAFAPSASSPAISSAR